MYEKELNLDIAKPRYHGYSDQILPVPWSSLFRDSTLNENNGKTVFKAQFRRRASAVPN